MSARHAALNAAPHPCVLANGEIARHRKPVLPRGAVYEAATAVITATHGPRPTIGVIPHHSHNAGYRVVATDRSVAQFIAGLESAAAASAWDRRVSALCRAIVSEKRMLL